MSDVKIEVGWKDLLHAEFSADYFNNIVSLIKNDLKAGKTIYPPGQLIFKAFNDCPLDKLKVVILGQDPYHGPGEAMGLCFSVPKGITIPPSLKNIYKELQRCFGYPVPAHGDLSHWSEQGVLLLNASLTVQHKMPNSHKDIGWHQFTDAVIQRLNQDKNHLVFMLWGNFAKSKKAFISIDKHLVLESTHPSPLAGNTFIGNNHFLLANQYLIAHGKTAIDWQII